MAEKPFGSATLRKEILEKIEKRAERNHRSIAGEIAAMLEFCEANEKKNNKNHPQCARRVVEVLQH